MSIPIKKTNVLNQSGNMESKRQIYTRRIMKNTTWLLVLCLLISCTSKEESFIELPPEQGARMLLIGNSFFKPYAQKLDEMAPEAGFEKHNSTTVFRGGENGRPINFWNDTTSQEHQRIKETLDEGDIAYFGMTSGHDADDPIEGHRAWIAYALQKNPNIAVFIAIPPADFPADWEQRAQDNGFDTIEELYTYFVNAHVHTVMIEGLRAEFPGTKIFTIPTGWAAINVAQMQEDNVLLDDIALFGPTKTSIFTDEKGHQGDIVKVTGGLLWLNSLYAVDLSTHDTATGFQTDLHKIAQEIAENHDPNYKNY